MKTVQLELTREQAQSLLAMLEEKTFYAHIMACMVEDDTGEETKKNIDVSFAVCKKLAEQIKQALGDEDINDLLKV